MTSLPRVRVIAVAIAATIVLSSVNAPGVGDRAAVADDAIDAVTLGTTANVRVAGVSRPQLMFRLTGRVCIGVQRRGDALIPLGPDTDPCPTQD